MDYFYNRDEANRERLLTLHGLIKNRENEVVEFKEANRDFDDTYYKEMNCF